MPVVPQSQPILRSKRKPIVSPIGVLRCVLLSCFLLLMYAAYGVHDGVFPSDAAGASDVPHARSGGGSVDAPVGRERDKGESVTVAYAISLIKCGDHVSNAAGLTDASLVLRHSVHLTSVRNPSSGSKYDYKMYAIVHRQAEGCSQVLKDAGFEVMVLDPPVKQSDIRGEVLRKKIHRERCCGSDEFVKLFAYTLPEEIIVHVDVDFAFYKPMDHLYDAILYDKDSPRGRAARSKIELEFPDEGSLPNRIGAFWTKDWPQTIPSRKAGYQAGFLVARRDPTVFGELKEVILEGNYTDGFGRDNGWGGRGYGGFVGAMAMQGLIAYYYDVVRPNTAVEVNHCRHNHMGMDTLYRSGGPSFMPKHPKVGKCRNDRDYCEDCMKTPFENIYSVHYTKCRKPWQCIGIGAPSGKTEGGPRGNAIDTSSCDLEHCLELIGHWHDLRTDFERTLFDITKDESIHNGSSGTYKVEVFKGHCTGEGNDRYKTIEAAPESFKMLSHMYD